MMKQEDLPGVEQFENWAHKTVLKYVERNDPNYEDFIQETRIGLWKGSTTYKPGQVKSKDKNYSEKDAYVGWITRYAEWHLLKILGRKSWTGMPHRAGKLSELIPTKSPLSFSALENINEKGEGYLPLHVEKHVSLPDQSEAVEASFHLGEIVRAINTLSLKQREYIYGVFWKDKTHTEVVGAKNYSMKDRVISHLEKELPHLRTLVRDE